MTTSQAKEAARSQNELEAIAAYARRRSGIVFWSRFYRSPFWLLFFVALWAWIINAVNTIPNYSRAFNYVKDGVQLTIFIAVVGYAAALVLGLILGIIRARPPQPPPTGSPIQRWLGSAIYVVLYNLATFYVEFMRGIPSLVFVLLAGFVIVPALRDLVNTSIVPLLNQLIALFPNTEPLPNLTLRAVDPATGITALAMIYAAYLSEVFRAGIQGVPKGQVEAARSLGMTRWQVMRLIVIPQAVRAILPPLGNDFIAIIKDTSLLTILGVNEITQLSRKWVGTSFAYPETYGVLSMIYLTLTIVGSLIVQFIERQLRTHER